jgi:LytS/YehU family sensor histidine kinase
VYEEWIKISAYLLIFLLNIGILIPKLIYRKKYKIYFTFTIIAIIFITTLSVWIQKELEAKSISQMPPMELGPGMPPMELSSSMPAPIGYNPDKVVIKKSVYTLVAENLIIAILIIGASTTIKITSRWLNEENRRKDIEKEQLITELALLRHQVNPHFLMNTLNNILALIDINTETAKDAVIKLSVLMRYLLYDSAEGKTTLIKEVEFIRSYIDLMKLRFTRKVSIKCSVPRRLPEVEIPPMLFISFIENAFKHGIDYQQKSYVHFKLDVSDKKNIVCTINNSKHPVNENVARKYSGIGMANVKKTLELLYKNTYTLQIEDSENEYKVHLTIPMYINDVNG